MKKSLHLLLAALLVTVGACNDDPLFEIPPEAPTTVAAAVQGTSATITWTPGAGATSQEVRMSPVVAVPASAGTALLVEDDRVQTFDDNTTSSALFEDLTEGTTYSATVTAINGSSRTSSEPIVVQIAGSVLAPVLNSCEAAEGGADPSSVFMEWTAIDGAENYAVTLTPAGGGDALADVAPASTTSWIWDSTIYEITEGETYTCQVASVIGGETYGSNTLEYTVAGNAAPVATITAPVDLGEYFNTEVLTFSGTATDAEDGDLTGESLVWTSDVDSQLGTGEEFTIDPGIASLGAHVITLTATDGDGATGEASVNITIVEATSTISFASTVQPFYVDNGCTSCHVAGGIAESIPLDTYDAIVYGVNTANPAQPMIVIGDPTGGVLIPQLGTAHGGGPFDTFVNDSFSPWVEDGAPNN